MGLENASMWRHQTLIFKIIFGNLRIINESQELQF
jgi:hypothetical protein